MKPKHTPEPWHVQHEKAGVFIFGRDKVHPFFVAGLPFESDTQWYLIANCTNGEDERFLSDDAKKANAARIVACVNACRGIADPGAIPDLIEAARKITQLARLDCRNENCPCVQCGIKRELLGAIARADGRKS
jgi:hypothetical protein